MSLPQFRLLRPRTVDEAVSFLSKHATSTRVLAGGTDLIPVSYTHLDVYKRQLYDIPNIQYDGYRVLTNKPACGAMRGHGTVNVRFAFESQLDELAAKIAMDPAEIRQRNLLKPPCITVNGLRVQSYGLPECIEKTVERSGWKQRHGK